MAIPQENAQQHAPSAIAPDRIALIVGVSTPPHSGDEIEASLRSALSDIFTNLSSTYRFTPIVVLSSLACDAAITAAEVANTLDIPVVACLPSSPRECENSLASAEARARFIDALALCRRVDIVPTIWEPKEGPSADRYISHFSHIMLTVSNDDGLHVRVGRESGAFDSQGNVENSLHRVDQCNRDLLRYGSPLRVVPTIDSLRRRAEAASNQLQRITFGFLYLLYVVAIFATAAQYVADQYVKYAMLLAAFGAYQLARRFDFENRYQDYRALSEGLRVQSGWISAGLHSEEAERYYLKMQESELRWIRMALSFAYFAFGAPASRSSGSVSSTACQDWLDGQRSYFATAARRDQDWLRTLLIFRRTALCAAIVASGALIVWLYLSQILASASDQSDSIAASPRVPNSLSALLHWTSNSLAVAEQSWSSLKQSQWLSALDAWDTGGKGRPPHHATLVRWSSAALALYGAIALLISNYAEKRSFAQNVRRYERMLGVFERAKNQLEAMGDQDSESGREVIRELGRAALVEQADWLLTRRDRPLAFVS